MTDDIERSVPSPFPRHRFTYEEYRRAFGLLMTEAEASAVAADVLSSALDVGEAGTDLESTTSMLTQDVLILLSFLSPELERRVDEIRAEWFSRAGTADDRHGHMSRDEHERLWNERRGMLRRRLEAEGRL